MTIDPDSLQIYTARVSAVAAEVVISGPWAGRVPEARVIGPFCLLANTLKTRLPVRWQPATASPDQHQRLQTRTVVTDPVEWSPQLPAWYEVELNETTEQLEQGRRTTLRFAIRSLLAQRQSLYWQGRRYVLRIVSWNRDWPPAWPEMRESGTSLLVPWSWTEILEGASDHGVPLLVDLGTADTRPNDLQLLKLTRYGGVVGAVHHEPGDLERTARLAPNLLRVFAANDQRGTPSGSGAAASDTDEPWRRLVQLWWMPAALLDQTAPHQLARPVLAVGVSDVRTDHWRTLRRGADGLQARLSPRWDCAGYAIVNSRS